LWEWGERGRVEEEEEEEVEGGSKSI